MKHLKITLAAILFTSFTLVERVSAEIDPISLCAFHVSGNSFNLYYEDELKTKMELAFKTWRSDREDLLSEGISMGLIGEEGMSQEINGHEFGVELILGSGNDGKSYLINYGDKRAVAKNFKSPEKLQRNLESIEKESDSVRLPRVLEIDYDTNTVIFEYLKGVPLQYILENVDLSDSDRRWIAYALTRDGVADHFIHNALIEVETGLFSLFDPY